MKCDRVIPLLNRFQDGECHPETASAINDHLKRCDRCRREFLRIDQIISEIQEIKAVTPSSHFTARVMGNLPVQKPAHRIPAPAFIYSAVFILFFVLGLLVTVPLNTVKQMENREITLVELLMKSQNLNHFDTHQRAIDLIRTGGQHEE